MEEIFSEYGKTFLAGIGGIGVITAVWMLCGQGGALRDFVIFAANLAT